MCISVESRVKSALRSSVVFLLKSQVMCVFVESSATAVFW